MKKTKMEKGITLVALIITIIVLLILAVVAITAINNDGIFGHANNAATKFNDAQGNEQNDLNTYEDLLNRYGGGSTVVTPDPDEPETPVVKPTQWTLDRTTLKVQKEGYDDLTVGDYVNYVSGVEGYTDANGWRVLGAADDQILLVSSPITVENDWASNYNFTELVDGLDSKAALYRDENYSTLSRAMRVEDINNITGYTPSGTNVNYEYNFSTYIDTQSPAFDMLKADGYGYTLASMGGSYTGEMDAYEGEFEFDNVFSVAFTGTRLG